METYKNVSQDIRSQLDAEAEVVKIILIGIDNDIYAAVDACPNACEMWKAIERLKKGESINVQDLETNLVVTLVKQSQELKTVSYHKLYDILKQHQNEVNEIRAEGLARTANPLALVAQQQPIYHPQPHPTHYTQNSSTRPQQATTRNRGISIVNSPQPMYDQEPAMVVEDDEIGTGYDNQRAVNVAGDRDIVARECQKPKREKDATYHKEKMLLCKLEEAGIQLKVTPDVVDNYGPMFDAKPLQKVQHDDDNYNVFASNREHPGQPESVNDIYPDEHNIIMDSFDMSHDRDQDDQNDNDDLTKERDLLASLIEKLKCEIDDSKNCNKLLESSNKILVDKLTSQIEDFKNTDKILKSSNTHFKEANNELLKINQLMFKDPKKFKGELEKCHDKNYMSKGRIKLPGSFSFGGSWLRRRAEHLRFILTSSSSMVNGLLATRLMLLQHVVWAFWEKELGERMVLCSSLCHCLLTSSFVSEIFKSLSFCLDRLCCLAILCLDQHAHTLHHLESLLTISLDRLDIFEGRSLISEFFEHEHVVMNPTSAGMRHHHLHLYIQRISLTGFPAQSVGSSNTDVLDLPCLLVLITGTSQSRQHVDTSLIHIESRKSPTAVLFDDDTGRISIRHCEY
ncbi:hypothetical protein Tco_1561824 [Tanacetum coccineum]